MDALLRAAPLIMLFCMRKEMKTPARFAISTAAVATVFLLLNGVGWAAVFFWKSKAIALACAILAVIVCPSSPITVLPGSPLDTPLFFVPTMILSFMVWGGIITLIWTQMKRGKQNKAAAH